MPTQFLTYPHNTKYDSTNWASQVKQGTGGGIPCQASIYAASSIVQDSQSGQWWADGNGNVTYSFSSSNNHPFNQTWGNSDQRGLHYHLESKKNQQWAKYFDIGAEGGRSTGHYINSNARSSWLREVTALWFLFHGHTTYESQGCYAHVEKVGIRYRDPNGYLKIYECSQQLSGSISLLSGVRGASKEVFGYAVPNNHRSTICRNDYRFLGVRIQIMLKKTQGSQSRTICGGVTGIRLGLGESPTSGYNTTNKRALVLRGSTTWNDFSSATKTKDMLETR